MPTVESKYLGELRCESVHLQSSSQLLTDAPSDNQGKGEAFSPTDLLATSLGTCILTTMGIAARTHGIAIENATASVTKIMAADPRRVAEVIVELKFPSDTYSDKEKLILKKAALGCPVHISLHPDLKKTIHFQW
ncbi:MAG: OsmC family protein [Mucilaginibacter polytrichastri]|nr:OsmC family protein [Mucilaginibacter polytrichastri]